MKLLLLPFQQLVERRLWPLAVLLVAALAAAPVVLTHDEEDVPAPAVAGAGAQGQTEPIVSVADASRTDSERRVLGKRKDPFRPAIKARAAATPAATAAPSGSGPGSSSSSAAAGAGSGASAITPTSVTVGGGASPAAGGTPTTPVPQPAKPAKPTFELYSLSVRFGPSTGPLSERMLKRLKGLPGGQRPALIYLGLKADHETAVFLVDGTAKVQGDGRCDPGNDDCQTLTMKAGDTEFIDMPGGRQYELDLITIHASKTSDAIAARAARTAEAPGGREAMRRLMDRVGRYRYSSDQGTLTVLRGSAWKAARAEAARAARASRVGKRR